MSENLIVIGFVLLFIAILLIIVGMIGSGKVETKFGFGGFIGPFPFGFANDPKMLWFVIIISIILLILFLFPLVK